MNLADTIVADVMRRLPVPKLTTSMRRARRVRIGKAYRMDLGPVADAFTGMIGYVVRVCTDNMCEVEGPRGVFVSASRIETLDPQHERGGVPDVALWDAVVGSPPRVIDREYRTDKTRAENVRHFELRLVAPWCVTRVEVTR